MRTRRAVLDGRCTVIWIEVRELVPVVNDRIDVLDWFCDQGLEARGVISEAVP